MAWDAVAVDPPVLTNCPPDSAHAPVIVHPVVPLLKSPFVTNSGPSATPRLLSKIKPTACSTAVTGVVPALSVNIVPRSEASYHAPGSPWAKRLAGVKPRRPNAAMLPRPTGTPLRTSTPKKVMGYRMFIGLA